MALPATAREQVTVALQMIDKLDGQLGPIEAVRYSGLDVTVHQSDQRRAPGHLSRQGPPALRWALYEATQSAHRKSSPDREYFLQAAERLGGNRACLAVARKLLKRSYHTLRELGEEALLPA